MTEISPLQLQSLKPVFDTALDAVVAMWPDGTVAEWNKIAEQTFGWCREEAVGQLLANLIVPAQHRAAHGVGIGRYNRTGQATVLDRRLEISALHRDGHEFPVELSITALPGEERLFIGFMRDITKRKAHEERLVRQAREGGLFFQLSQSAARSEAVEPVLKDALDAICEITGWPVGHALVPRADVVDELISTGIWHGIEEPGFEALRDATERVIFRPGVGLPGEVLRRGEPVWVADTQDDAIFVRKGLGFASAFAFPLMSPDRIIAVLEFFAHKEVPPDPNLLLTVRALGEQVGRAMERSRAIGQLKELNLSLEERVAERTADLAEAHARIAQALEDRARADALYRAYFENSPEALFVVSVGVGGHFYVEEVNPAHEASVGLKADDIRRRRVDEILPPQLAEPVIARYRLVLETGQMHHYTEVFPIRGELQHWDTTLVPVKDAEGRITHLFGSSRNITRQVAAEEALRQSQKMEAMGQLTGGVAHDFNNLLTPIVGGLDLLQRRGVGGEREQRVIAGAIQSAERAKTLVQRLLAFARRQPLQLTAVDVGHAIREMGTLLSSTLGPRIRLQLQCAADLPAARADVNQLDMALLNLAVNARDAMPNGGDLSIVADAQELSQPSSDLAPGRYVRVAVVDSGIGMDAATLERCTDPFFSTKGIGQGTGLGLSMVQGLTAQLGGALRIFSREGVGTTIELWLPATEATATESGSEAPVKAQLASGRALVVDDEELVRDSTESMLSELGYEVVQAASALEALDVLEQGARVDVLVTDHLMPQMTGTDLAYDVRARWPGIKVLIVSGYAEVEGIAPDLPRLTKPFRLADLAEALAL